MYKRYLTMAAAMLILLGFAACGKETAETTGPNVLPGVADIPSGWEQTDDPTQPIPSKGSPLPGEDGTVPVETLPQTTEPATQPAQTTPTQPQPTVPDDTKPGVDLSFEQYLALSAQGKTDFYLAFVQENSAEAFFQWYNAGLAQYKKDHPDLEIGDGAIVLPTD